VDGVDTVFHLAAATSGDADTYHRVTVEASQSLLDAAVAGTPSRVIFVSSLSVYSTAETADGKVIGEDAALDDGAGRSLYAGSKSAADSLAQRYLNCDAIALTIVRPGIVYGPRMTNPLTGIAISLAGKAWLAIGNPDKLLPLIYIDDLVEALIRIAHMPEAIGKVYNLVDGAMPTHHEYLTLYRKISGDRRPVIRLPLRTMLPLLRVVDWSGQRATGRCPQTVSTLIRLASPITFSGRRAQQELGIRPLTSVSIGLRNTLGYCSGG
jgi:nucleoside-diphosphate-sugar epimerase